MSKIKVNILHHAMLIWEMLTWENYLIRHPLETSGDLPMHFDSKQGDIETFDFTLSHERGSEQSERASERVSAAEGASEASSREQANE